MTSQKVLLVFTSCYTSWNPQHGGEMLCCVLHLELTHCASTCLVNRLHAFRAHFASLLWDVPFGQEHNVVETKNILHMTSRPACLMSPTRRSLQGALHSPLRCFLFSFCNAENMCVHLLSFARSYRFVTLQIPGQSFATSRINSFSDLTNRLLDVRVHLKLDSSNLQAISVLKSSWCVAHGQRMRSCPQKSTCSFQTNFEVHNHVWPPQSISFLNSSSRTQKSVANANTQSAFSLKFWLSDRVDAVSCSLSATDRHIWQQILFVPYSNHSWALSTWEQQRLCISYSCNHCIKVPHTCTRFEDVLQCETQRHPTLQFLMKIFIKDKLAFKRRMLNAQAVPNTTGEVFIPVLSTRKAGVSPEIVNYSCMPEEVRKQTFEMESFSSLRTRLTFKRAQQWGIYKYRKIPRIRPPFDAQKMVPKIGGGLIHEDLTFGIKMSKFFWSIKREWDEFKGALKLS